MAEADMVERVANVFYEIGRKYDHECNTAIYDEMARAAIAAMREPTEAMENIVERLRGCLQDAPHLMVYDRTAMADAIDEIERLREENAQLRMDHIAAHRVSVSTINWLEKLLEEAKHNATVKVRGE